MGHKVIFTPQSLDDLKTIVAFIAKDNPERARAFGNELIDRALSIASFPELGRIVREINDPSVREIIYGPYRIIHEVASSKQSIHVLRFWHGARGEPELKSSN